MSAYETIGARALLDLREVLVRHDENWKAWQLLSLCAPYIVQGRRDVQQALADQRQMVAHLLDPAENEAYYAANPHDRPFEDQYGLASAADALRIPRFRLLCDWLNERDGLRALDLACNDGILAAALEGEHPNVIVDGVDLGEDCITRARARGTRGNFWCTDLRADRGPLPEFYDAVALFEVIEHTHEPAATLAAAARHVCDGGHLWVSCPIGAVEKGNLPHWDRVERKGHVIALTPDDLQDLLVEVGEIEQIVGCPDGTMVARTRIDR